MPWKNPVLYFLKQVKRNISNFMNLTRGRIFRVAVQCRDLNSSNHDVGNTTCAMFKVEGGIYLCKKIHICAMYFRLLSTTHFRELVSITNLEQFNSRKVRLHLTKYKWVGIIAIKSERTQIHFLSDVLIAVKSLNLKVPNVNRRPPLQGGLMNFKL